MRHRASTLTRDTFDDAVALAMQAIDHSDIRAWTTHAGYAFGST